MNRLTNWLHYSSLSVLFILFIGVYLLVFGTYELYALASLTVFCFAVVRALNIYSRKRLKTGLIITYVLLFVLEFTSFELVIFSTDDQGLKYWLARISGIVLILSPFILERITTVTNHTVFAVPSVQEAGTLSYARFNQTRETAQSIHNAVSKLKGTLSSDNIRELANDLPRNNSFEYINNGSLTEAYFAQAEKALEDPYIYIVVSNTGSAASELIGVFTRKQFNHVSISFDEQLDTIISYNGGEKVYPPGLNAEMIEFFNKKEDASIGVYRLSVTREQKQAMLDIVRDINSEGSAYNLIGLVFKYSHRPNIMFCSQFVYSLLKKTGVAYFEKRPELVQPTDLVELDYFRKLEFVRLLTFR
ncbi:hypothetical protein [Reinekea sp. G2M2-21]|uniref:hypothetical protein n=1 Tax=Reinekea sp. G2M2-21 TaxID=2788942 RepID=UPI0018A8F5DD|nr:hypothetical protein [Reinekea sp. G2M2-21]